MSTNACIGCKLYSTEAKHLFSMSISRAREGIILIGQFPDFLDRHPGLDFPLSRLFYSADAISSFLLRLPDLHIGECSKLSCSENPKDFMKFQYLMEKHITLIPADCILASDDHIRALSLMNCLISGLGNDLQ